MDFKTCKCVVCNTEFYTHDDFDTMLIGVVKCGDYDSSDGITYDSRTFSRMKEDEK